MTVRLFRRRCPRYHRTFFRYRCTHDRDHAGKCRFGIADLGYLTLDLDEVDNIVPTSEIPTSPAMPPTGTPQP